MGTDHIFEEENWRPHFSLPRENVVCPHFSLAYGHRFVPAGNKAPSESVSVHALGGFPMRPFTNLPEAAFMKISSAFLVLSAALSLPAWGAGSVDAGRAAFPLCGSCHEGDPRSPRFAPYRFNASGLTAVFQAIGEMNGNLALGVQTINDIATFLGLPNGNDTDRFLDWAEDTLPQLLAPPRQTTLQIAGYSYRFYASSGFYVATKDGSVWYLNSRAPGAALQLLGTLRGFLDQMPAGR